jgi:hypothetical protein
VTNRCKRRDQMVHPTRGLHDNGDFLSTVTTAVELFSNQPVVRS